MKRRVKRIDLMLVGHDVDSDYYFNRITGQNYAYSGKSKNDFIKFKRQVGKDSLRLMKPKKLFRI